MAATQRAGGKKSKRSNKGMARKRYWLARHLEKTKVKKMMRAYGMSEHDAIEAWRVGREATEEHGAMKPRRHRIPDGYMQAGKK